MAGKIKRVGSNKSKLGKLSKSRIANRSFARFSGREYSNFRVKQMRRIWYNMDMKNGASKENCPAKVQAFVETETVELKTKYTDAIAKEFVAFLNTKGGTVYLGVADGGRKVYHFGTSYMQCILPYVKTVTASVPTREGGHWEVVGSVV